jgi:hypothetical protein
MFDSAGRQFNSRQTSAARDLDMLDVELGRLGLLPPPRYGVGLKVACGTAQRVSVCDVIEQDETRQAFLLHLCNLVGTGIPVNLSLEDFGSYESGIESWQRFCEIVRTALMERKLSGRDIGFCIHSHQMPLEAYCLIADAVLGCGPRYVFLDGLQMAAHGNSAVEQRAEANWSFLWRNRGMVRPVMPVYGGIVRSACPLLADEVATTVLPGTGLQGPDNSAWLPMILPIADFATTAGVINWRRLGNAMRESLAIAEQMLDQVSWESAQQRSDARENRRLAICITGIGDLVVRKGDDPTRFECLRSVAAVITRIRAELDEQSGRIASESGMLPALREADHVGQWSDGPHRDSWHQCWEDAVRQAAVRHRNLLVISPYSVIPSGATAGPVFGDLLPVIGLADAWTFAAPPAFQNWNVAQYRDFHRRARATIQGSHSASFVAAGV